MKHETAIEARTVASRRVRSAVQQNPTISREGLLERLFAVLFSRLVYPQIWEDPEVDREALQIRPDSHVVTIASGGCNVMSYLLDGPARVTALDLNRAHVALARLKLAAARHLSEWDDFHRLFGRADDAANIETYTRSLRANLDPATRAFWEGRALTGRRRINLFARNLYRHGALGYFISIAHLVSRRYGVDPRGMLATSSRDEQRAFFEDSLAPIFDKRLVRWLTSKRISLYLLGIPPAQYRALVGDGEMSDVLRERLRRLACDFDLSDNYFAWQAFGLRYGADEACTLPPYLREADFDRLKEMAPRAAIRHQSVTEFLAGQPEASADRYVLLDAQDWMSDELINELWAEITRTARPGARVIFRTAATDSVLPGRLSPELLSRWTYHEGQSLDLNAKDRSSIYGGFHLYSLKDAA